jgi:hypothetical protein
MPAFKRKAVLWGGAMKRKFITKETPVEAGGFFCFIAGFFNFSSNN